MLATLKKTPYASAFVAVSLVLVLHFLFYVFESGQSYWFMDDGMFHQFVATGFANELYQGSFFPRWISQINGGCGSPVFYFYSPLLYYFFSFFYLLFSEQIALQLVMFVVLYLAVLFFVKWARFFVSERSAIFGMFCYILAPYLWVNLYTRFAFAEVSAFLWLPAVLYYIECYFVKKENALIGLIISSALLVLSTVPGAVMVLEFSFIYALVRARFNLLKHWQALCVVILAVPALTAFYTLPLIEKLPHVLMGMSDYMFSEKFSAEKNFLTFATRIGVLLSILAIAYAVLATAMYLYIRKIRRVDGVRFFYVSTIVLLLLLTPAFSWFWQLGEVFSVIQFPWRLMLIISLLIAIMFAILCDIVKATTGRIVTMVCMLFLIGLLTVFPRNLIDKELIDKNAYYSSRTISAWEYLPSSVGSIVLERGKGFVSSEDCKSRLLIKEGSAEVQLLEWKGRHIEFYANSTEPSIVQVSQFYFNGWTNTQEKFVQPFPGVDSGLINLALPKGKQHIVLRLPWSIYEWVGLFLSCLAWSGLIGFIIYRKFGFKRFYPCPTDEA